MRARQPFLSDLFKARHEHGGSLRTGRRKLARPMDPKRPIHLVLKSDQAKGSLSLLRRWREIRRIVDLQASRCGIRIYQYANAGNHLHVLLKVGTRKGFQAFLRVVSGQIAQLVTGARKGRSHGRFWSALAYTRVVEWGRAFREARSYVLGNELETHGSVRFRPRSTSPPF